MKRLSPITVVGTSVLSLAIVILFVRSYLDELDQEYGKSWELTHPCSIQYLGCPFSPEPYWSYIQPLLYIGIAFCCIGIILISAKILNDKMKSSPKQY
jgi:hypothetical protein